MVTKILLLVFALTLLSTIAFAQDPSTIPVTDPSLIVQALQSRYWPAIVWGVILIGIYAIKMLPDKFNVWGKIPITARPIVVLAIGVVAAVGNAVVTKQPWLDVLIKNIFAALAAIGIDQVQSKLRKGGA